MKTIARWTAAAIAAGLLASCSTAPKRVAVAPPSPVPQELPYRWTQGAAPQAHEDAIAAFGQLHLNPG
jgi:hypothetical protein